MIYCFQIVQLSHIYVGYNRISISTKAIVGNCFICCFYCFFTCNLEISFSSFIYVCSTLSRSLILISEPTNIGREETNGRRCTCCRYTTTKFFLQKEKQRENKDNCTATRHINGSTSSFNLRDCRAQRS